MKRIIILLMATLLAGCFGDKLESRLGYWRLEKNEFSVIEITKESGDYLIKLDKLRPKKQVAGKLVRRGDTLYLPHNDTEYELIFSKDGTLFLRGENFVKTTSVELNAIKKRLLAKNKAKEKKRQAAAEERRQERKAYCDKWGCEEDIQQ